MTNSHFKNVRVHSTALIEEAVSIGEGTSVWDNVHIRRGAGLGRKCIVGEKTYIAYDVRIGNLVKLNASVYVCAGVTIEDGVMISAHTVFTNDKFPRAATHDLSELLPSHLTDETLQTVVRRGATIGANSTIGPGIEIGAFAMIGMGSVVTKSIPAYALAFGCPARVQGYVCSCGYLLGQNVLSSPSELQCQRCENRYIFSDDLISPLL